MKRCPFSALILATVIVALTYVDDGMADSDALGRSGLLGVWSFDCQRPPAMGNARETYTRGSGGIAVFTQNVGGSVEGKFRLESIKSAGDHRISYVAFNDRTGRRLYEAVTEIRDNAFRIVEMVSDRGRKVIENAVMLDFGIPVETSYRCSAGT